MCFLMFKCQCTEVHVLISNEDTEESMQMEQPLANLLTDKMITYRLHNRELFNTLSLNGETLLTPSFEGTIQLVTSQKSSITTFLLPVSLFFLFSSCQMQNGIGQLRIPSHITFISCCSYIQDQRNVYGLI